MDSGITNRRRLLYGSLPMGMMPFSALNIRRTVHVEHPNTFAASLILYFFSFSVSALPGGFATTPCRFAFISAHCRSNTLGGHPKSGHRGSVQNRPTDRSQDLTLLYRVGGRRGKKFLICVAEPWHSGYTGFAWAEDSGNAGMRPERRPRCRNGGAASSRPRS